MPNIPDDQYRYEGAADMVSTKLYFFMQALVEEVAHEYGKQGVSNEAIASDIVQGLDKVAAEFKSYKLATYVGVHRQDKESK